MAKIDVSFQIEVDEDLLRVNNISLQEVADSLFLETEDHDNSITLNTGIEVEGIIQGFSENEHFDVPLIYLKRIEDFNLFDIECLVNNKDVISIQKLIDAQYALDYFIDCDMFIFDSPQNGYGMTASEWTNYKLEEKKYKDIDDWKNKNPEKRVLDNPEKATNRILDYDWPKHDVRDVPKKIQVANDIANNVVNEFELRVTGPGSLKNGEDLCLSGISLKDNFVNLMKSSRQIIDLEQCGWWIDADLIDQKTGKRVNTPYDYGQDDCGWGYVTAETLFEGVLDGDNLFVRHKNKVRLEDVYFEEFIDTIQSCKTKPYPWYDFGLDDKDKKMIKDYNKIDLSFEKVKNLKKDGDVTSLRNLDYSFPLDKQHQQEFTKLFVEILNKWKDKENLSFLKIKPLTEEIAQKYQTTSAPKRDITKNAQVADKVTNKDINKKK